MKSTETWLAGNDPVRPYPDVLADEVVGLAGLGAVDEGADLVGVEDQGGAVRVGGLAEGYPAAGQLLRFQACATVVAPRLAPAVRAEIRGGHAVADVLHCCQISFIASRRMPTVCSGDAACAHIRSMASTYWATSSGLFRWYELVRFSP